MKLKYPVILALFCVPMAQAAHAADLFISEYVEGSSNNKALEIYNPTANTIDLSTYQFQFFFNGSTSASNSISLVGNIASGSTFVLADTDASAAILAIANQTNSGSFFNGDDAIELLNNGVVIDSIGVVGTDPGSAWGAGNISTKNNTIRRKTAILNGDAIAIDTFDPASEWDGFAQDDIADLGSHTFDGDTGGGTGGGTGGSGDIISNACVNCPDLEKITDASSFNDASYYAPVYAEISADHTAGEIKAALSDVIDGNKVLSYAEVWTALTKTDQDPANTDNVILLYKGNSIAKSSNGSGAASSNPDNWNREHVWAKSHGFSSDVNEAYTDIHHLRPSDISINSERGNKDFDLSDAPVSEAPLNRVDNDSFEPRDTVKGDVARMLFYMDVRYEGFDTTPDLHLEDRLTSGGEPAIGRLCRLIEWNSADPVDIFEQNRNDRIYEFQGNRNPFIDHPEWVSTFFSANTCEDLSGDGGGDTGGGDDGGTGGDDGGDTGGNTGSITAVFINEIHYDNASTDIGESIEIAGAVGTDLSGMSLVLYNGSNGSRYNTNTLSGVLANQQGGFGTLSFSYPTNGIQNGSPDAIALVNADGIVLQFLSYEGVLTATDGPAQGMTSVDIGVVESGSAAVGESLQLTGTGFKAEDFSWAAEATNTFGTINNEQHFVTPTPFINEIHYDNAGSDEGESIEIAGAGGTDLSGMSLVLYNGSNGSRYNTNTLSGVLANQQGGFGTLSFSYPTNGIQNGSPDAIALVNADGIVLQFLSYEGVLTATDGPAQGMSSIDIGVAESGSAAVGESLQLIGTGFKAEDFSWTAEATNTFGLINSGQTFGSAGGDPVDPTDPTDPPVVDLGVCYEPATLISAVQGDGDISPLVDQTVVVEGVVSASFPESNGYYVQEQSGDEDANPLTSEGVLVYSNAESLPAAGNVVRVKGKVIEYYQKTEITEDTVLNDCGTGSIAATSISLPFESEQVREALEGMYVTTSQALIVTDSYDLGTYGDLTLSNGRIFTPTNLYLPASAEAIALAKTNALNKLALDDNIAGRLPTQIIYPTGGLSAVNTVRTGDTVPVVTGVLDYSYDKYRIYPTEAINFVQTNPRTAAPELMSGNLKVASLNVLNLFNGDGQGAGFPTERGANTDAEFERQIAKTVAAISAINADIVGLMEIENDADEGQFSTIAQLTDRLNAELGAGTYAYVDTNGKVGSDAIAVGLLYKPAVVSLDGAVKILNSSNSIQDEQGPLFLDYRNRPALNQKFSLVSNGESLVVSVNHLKSKGSGCGVGDDSTNGQGNCNLTRTRAAKALTSFIAQQYPDTAALIIGDLNSNAKEDPIRQIEQAGFTNLMHYFNGNNAYSYTYGGEFGYLDHGLANARLLPQVVDAVEWHINADEPTLLDYNVEDKTPEQVSDFYATDAYRVSDHDPVIISLNLKSSELSADVNGDSNVDMVDYTTIAMIIGATEGSANFNPAADFDRDGVITFADISLWYQQYLLQ